MKNIILPRLGETMEEGTIRKWLIAENDNFTRGQIIVEIESDKTTIELPALQDGILKKIIKNNGDIAKIGEPIAIFE
jgi:pyruvate dehydrogenase E2 component (dihydrolipoamide acetyltransferase)